jgi:hypothetical protein
MQHATCNVQRATCQMHACFGYITLTMLRRARGSVCGLTLRWQLHVACRMLHAACMLLACMCLACMYLGVRCAHIVVCVSGLACPIRLHRACAAQGLHCMSHCMLHDVHRMLHVATDGGTACLRHQAWPARSMLPHAHSHLRRGTVRPAAKRPTRESWTGPIRRRAVASHTFLLCCVRMRGAARVCV